VLVRNSAKTVLHTLYLLKQLPSLDSLPVNDLIYILGKHSDGFFSFSVADPGSGIWCLFDPWIRDQHPGSATHWFFKSL
jgi:hypothetical protein